MTLQMNAPYHPPLGCSLMLPLQDDDLPAFMRANGVLRLSLSKHPHHGYQRDVHEEGTARLRFPRHHDGPLNVMMMNVAGGVAGGDRFVTTITANEGTDLTVSTPAAERIYRSAGAASYFDIELNVEKDASLAWQPQETILFNGAKLDRRIRVDCKSSARLMLSEMLVLGRRESGETFTAGDVRDRWDIRIDGKLVMAERLHLAPDVLTQKTRSATFGTSHAFATLVVIEPNGMERLEQHRQALEFFRSSDVEAASTAYSGLVVMRFRSSKAGALRAMVENILKHVGNTNRSPVQQHRNELRQGTASCN